MPSPIAHVAAGYALYRWIGTRVPAPVKSRPALFILAACACGSLLPDLDSIVGVLAGDLGRFHNNLSHSITAGILVSLLLASVMRVAAGTGFTPWFFLALACYEIHLLMDYFTVGRGIMAFWPFVDARFQAPWPVFLGVQWGLGVWTIEHIWTALSELVFVGMLAFMMYLVSRMHRRKEEI
ncbi:MAG: metal-dependent hydrolase [bacterium]